MIKFAAKLLLFVLLFFIYDKAFILVKYYSAETEIDKRLEYIIKGGFNKDIIITGSSTGSRDMIAKQIEDETGLSTYNLCYPGSNVEFHEFILRTLLKFNNPPRILLLVVDDDAELKYDETINFRKERLYPLVKYPYIRQELINVGDKDRFFSKFLILHQLNITNFDLRKKVFTPVDTIMNCGSMPISWKRLDDIWDFIPDERIYQENLELIQKVDAYRKIVNLCNSSNTKLIIIFPPTYQAHSKSFENRIRQLSGDSTYFYIYNTENPVYRNQDYFFDGSHLMRKGAVIFTDEIILFLNGLIKNEFHIFPDNSSPLSKLTLNMKSESPGL